jgi:hypothetical protein
MLIEQSLVKRHLPIEGTHYEFLDNDDCALAIKIIKNPTIGADPFEELVYMYQYVSLHTPKSDVPDDFEDIDADCNFVEEEEPEIRLKFDYVVVENPKNYATRSNPDFEILVGDILTNVLIDATTNVNTKYTMFSKTDSGIIEKLKPIKKNGKFGKKILGNE